MGTGIIQGTLCSAIHCADVNVICSDSLLKARTGGGGAETVGLQACQILAPRAGGFLPGAELGGERNQAAARLGSQEKLSSQEYSQVPTAIRTKAMAMSVPLPLRLKAGT